MPQGKLILIFIGAIALILVSAVRWLNLFNLGFSYDTNLFFLWGSVPLQQGFANFWRDYTELFDYLPGSVYLFMLISWIAQVAELNHTNFVVILKIFNWIFEIGFSLIVYYVSRRYGGSSRVTSLILAVLTYCLPAFWFVSNVWGQIDTPVVVLSIISVILIYRAVEAKSIEQQNKYAFLSGVTFAIGFWIKMQLILLLPIMALFHLTWRNRDVLVRQLLGAGLVSLVVIAIPLVVNPWRLVEVMLVPFTRSEVVSRSAYSLWRLIGTSNNSHDDLIKIGAWGISISLAALGSFIALNVLSLGSYSRAWGGTIQKMRKIRMSFWDFVYLATIQTTSFFLLVTKMHERYLHFGAMLVILCVAAWGARKGFYGWVMLAVTLNFVYFLNLIGSYYSNGYRDPAWVGDIVQIFQFDMGRLAALLGIICLILVIGWGGWRHREVT
jgi:dolichyl-phosphate-mannose-protein mannosyltransferase